MPRKKYQSPELKAVKTLEETIRIIIKFNLGAFQELVKKYGFYDPSFKRPCDLGHFIANMVNEIESTPSQSMKKEG